VTLCILPISALKGDSEIDREANIAKNRALFEDLGLKQTLDSLSTAPTKPAKASATPVQAKRKRERLEETLAPRRQSRRLKIKANDESPEEKKLREVRRRHLHS
jgi:hypothetical protein